MIRTYALKKKNELRVRDVDSLDEMEKLVGESSWLWLDSAEPNDEELESIIGLLKETEIIEDIKKRQVFSHRVKVNDYVMISIPFVSFEEKWKIYPIYLFAKEKILITIRSRHSSESVNSAVETFRDCLSKVCQYGNASSFIVGRLFHEMSSKNLDTVMMLRKRTEEIEENTLRNPGDKKIGKKVFAQKRNISALERILWTQRELILSIEEGVIPAIHSSEMDEQVLGHAVSNITRQISLLTANDDALDNILSLQDLGMIHRVERMLIYLTLVTLIANIIMILIEVDILGILSG